FREAAGIALVEEDERLTLNRWLVPSVDERVGLPNRYRLSSAQRCIRERDLRADRVVLKITLVNKHVADSANIGAYGECDQSNGSNANDLHRIGPWLSCSGL